MPVTNFVWDGNQYLMETNEANTTQAVFTNEPDEHTNLISQRRDGASQYAHFDAVGSTRQLTNASETVTDEWNYDAWGNEVLRSGVTEFPFQFVGMFGYYFDSETNTFYIIRRILEPENGRWLSADPLLFTDGANMYWYVRNRPTIDVDQSGLYPGGAGSHWDGSAYGPIYPWAYHMLNRIEDELRKEGVSKLTFEMGWDIYIYKYPNADDQPFPYGVFRKSPVRAQLWTQGCVGVTSAFLGLDSMNLSTDDHFRNCYTTLEHALRKQERMNDQDTCGKTGKNLKGEPAKARVFGFKWNEWQYPVKNPRTSCPRCGFIFWNDTIPRRTSNPVFDFGYYDERLKAFWHANYSEATEGGHIKVSTPENFASAKQATIYCVTCESDSVLDWNIP